MPRVPLPSAGWERGKFRTRSRTHRSGYGHPHLLDFGRISRTTLGGSGTARESMVNQTKRHP